MKNIEELKLYRINEVYAKYIYYQDEKVLKAFNLKYQIKWCNENKEQIINNAKKLYNLITNKKGNLSLTKRCCNFKFLETKLNQFILNQEKSE